MRILFVGDVVGRPGKAAIDALIPALRNELNLDAVVVNCENIAGGRGVTPEIATELLEYIDVLTTGNHVWQYKSLHPYLDQEPRLIRPANYPKGPGRGAYLLELDEATHLGVIQVEGRVFMRNLDCPFKAVERELKALAGKTKNILVDVHAETTSEKQALAWYFDGQVSAMCGTHTHVQTADERVLPKGTAYITDAGMTGPYHSVIGMEVSTAIDRFLTQRHTPHEVALARDVWLCGVVIDIDPDTGRARSIERVKRTYGEVGTETI